MHRFLRHFLITFFLSTLPSFAGCGKQDTSPQPVKLPAGNRTVEPDTVDHLAAARKAAVAGDFDAAENEITQHLLTSPNDAFALEFAGDIATQKRKHLDAAEMYAAARDSSPDPSLSLFDKQAQAFVGGGKPFAAVAVLQQAIEQFPNQPNPRYDLAGLATMLGITNEAIEPLQWLLQRQMADADSLLVLASPSRVQPDTTMCEQLVSDQNLRPSLGLALADARAVQWNAVKERLGPVVAKHPDFLPAQMLYGRALAEMGDPLITDWQKKLPAEAIQEAEFWLVAGLWASQQRQFEQAARCYWECMARSPAPPPEALSGLVLCLSQLDRREDAAAAEQILSLQTILGDAVETHLERKSQSQTAAMAVANALVDLGRLWEAEAWARYATSLAEDPVADASDKHRAIHQKLSLQTPIQSPQYTTAARIDLSDLQPVNWNANVEVAAHKPLSQPASIVFRDQANKRGLIHTCEIAASAIKEGHWIYQSVGGGVSVIDFNLDGWPDIAAAMLDGKPNQVDSSANALFMNLDGKFKSIASVAGYNDFGFSHGIAVGDYNSDGFPDLFDANIGRNRLYRNNGDGTFSEVDAKITSKDWTTSVVMADFDGDAIADLFEINYCGGEAPYIKPCRNKKGLLSTCPPLEFDAQIDRVWRGKPDGTFEEMTSNWMEQTSPGRGLGVVVGQFDQRAGLDVYVANDMTVNHLWSPSTSDSGFRLVDLAAIRGLGFNAQSNSQASMGMAAADPDQDGDTDFFLTHFADDHNTYYEQVAPGLWRDRSYQTGLAAPSMKLLGFGTDWCDFDNNGTLELMVANGHVDDVQRDDVGYRMRPQLFSMNQQKRYEEVDRTQLGQYFSADHLGRALVSCDINRDGRSDIAISHLYDPVALLVNQTERAGNSVSFTLQATTTQRDAIGAKLSAKVAGRTLHAQLTAGDGYMCSNQRRITLGTGDHFELESVEIEWPSGVTSKLGSITSGADYLVVEGQNEAFQLGEHIDH